MFVFGKSRIRKHAFLSANTQESKESDPLAVINIVLGRYHQLAVYWKKSQTNGIDLNHSNKQHKRLQIPHKPEIYRTFVICTDLLNLIPTTLKEKLESQEGQFSATGGQYCHVNRNAQHHKDVRRETPLRYLQEPHLQEHSAAPSNQRAP